MVSQRWIEAAWAVSARGMDAQAESEEEVWQVDACVEVSKKRG